MGAAAIAARIPLPRAARRDSARACGLAFDRPGGPLVAVCGLAGGAGTSTLAFTLARQAAAESKAPVLVTESRAEQGGLAVLAGRATALPLVALARSIAEDQAPAGTFVELEPGLRLVAATPRRHERVSADAVRALLRQARDAHGLVIVDCGTDWATDGLRPRRTPRTSSGRCRRLRSGWRAHAPCSTATSSQRPGRGARSSSQLRDRGAPRSRVRALRRLARSRCDRLVLIAHDRGLAEGESAAGESTMRALTGLAPTLRSAAVKARTPRDADRQCRSGLRGRLCRRRDHRRARGRGGRRFGRTRAARCASALPESSAHPAPLRASR